MIDLKAHDAIISETIDLLNTIESEGHNDIENWRLGSLADSPSWIELRKHVDQLADRVKRDAGRPGPPELWMAKNYYGEFLSRTHAMGANGMQSVPIVFESEAEAVEFYGPSPAYWSAIRVK